MRILSHRFLRAVAVKPFRALVPEKNLVIQIVQANRVLRVIQQRRLFAHFFFRQLAMRNIHHHTGHAYRRSVIVAHDVPAVKNIRHGFVRAKKPVLARPGFTVRINRRANPRNHPILVLRVNAIVPRFRRRLDSPGRVAKPRLKSVVPPAFICDQVPVPDHIIRRPRRQPESLFTFAQFLLGARSFTRVSRAAFCEKGILGGQISAVFSTGHVGWTASCASP